MGAIDNREKFLTAWDVFRKLDHLITYRTVEVFLGVAENNGAKHAEIRALFPFSQPSFSRHLGKLSKQGYKKGNKRIPGFDLIMTIDDYDDYRCKRVFLTPKGIEVYSQFNQALKGGFGDV